MKAVSNQETSDPLSTAPNPGRNAPPFTPASLSGAGLKSHGKEVKSPPAFQFYPADFLMGAAAMSPAERGAYIVLLCYQWHHRSIPSDPEQQRRIAGCKVSAAVLEKFPPDEQGELKNLRLELERQKQDAWREKCAAGGRKSGVTRGARVVELPFEQSSKDRGNQKATLQSSSSYTHTQVRLHGIPANVEEVIAYGQTIHPKKDDETCRDFWAFYEGQARTNPSGEIFWVTSGDAVVTNWKAKLPSFEGKKTHATNQPNRQRSVDRNEGTLNAGTSAQYGKLAAMGKVSVPQGPAT